MLDERIRCKGGNLRTMKWKTECHLLWWSFTRSWRKWCRNLLSLPGCEANHLNSNEEWEERLQRVSWEPWIKHPEDSVTIYYTAILSCQLPFFIEMGFLELWAFIKTFTWTSPHNLFMSSYSRGIIWQIHWFDFKENDLEYHPGD